MTGSYRIIGESYAHDGPIRCMSIGPLGEVVTGCQSDSPNVKRWTITEHTLEFSGSPIFHDHWVTAVTSSVQLGFIVTGCMDCKIRVYDTTGNPVMVLEGHVKGVISFSWTAGGSLISGSWDGTAKIWDLSRNGLLTHSLGPHENGVNVLGLPDGRIATTSTGEAVDGKPANYRLRLWDGTTAAQIGESISDHGGSIRSITMAQSR
jgi:WD40 repeat protein